MISRGYVLPVQNADTETLMDGLGFGLKRFLDPRRALKRGLKFAKVTADPRKHLQFAKATLDPAHLLTGKKKRHHRRRKLTPAQMQDWIAKRRARGLPIPRGIARLFHTNVVMPVGDTHAQQLFGYAEEGMGLGWGTPGSEVVLPVASAESMQTLGALGFKFPHIGRKLRKKIAIAAAIGAATYFGGGALVSKFGAKGVAKGAAGAALKKAAKKATSKKTAKTVAQAIKTVAEAEGVIPTPGSIAAQQGSSSGGGGGFMPAGGGELAPYDFDEQGDVTSTKPTEAGMLGGSGIGTFLLVGGLIAAAMMGRRKR